MIKKGNEEKVEEYRGIILMTTAYKIYAKVLAERLRKEIEEKGIMPKNQMRFRRGRGIMDNVYILNYIVNRQIEKKEGKLVALFVDLRAAFDSENRGMLLETMKKRGVREGLREREW